MATVGYGDISPKSEAGRAVAIVTMIVGIGMFSLITAKLAEMLLVLRTHGTRKAVVDRGPHADPGLVAEGLHHRRPAGHRQRQPARERVDRRARARDHNDMADEIRAQVPGAVALEHPGGVPHRITQRSPRPGDGPTGSGTVELSSNGQDDRGRRRRPRALALLAAGR